MVNDNKEKSQLTFVDRRVFSFSVSINKKNSWYKFWKKENSIPEYGKSFVDVRDV